MLMPTRQLKIVIKQPRTGRAGEVDRLKERRRRRRRADAFRRVMKTHVGAHIRRVRTAVLAGDTEQLRKVLDL